MGFRPAMTKKINYRSKKLICPKCGNDKMWGQRGHTEKAQYKYKCCKCGHKVVN